MQVFVIVAALVAAAHGATRPATRAPTAAAASTSTTLHPSCGEDAYHMCQDSCRAKNYEVLEEFIADVLDYGGVVNNGEGNRTRRGVVPSYIQMEVERFLRRNVR